MFRSRRLSNEANRYGAGVVEVAELPSYLSMVRYRGSTMLPRFWLEAQYSPIARDSDELGWKLTVEKWCSNRNRSSGARGHEEEATC